MRKFSGKAIYVCDECTFNGVLPFDDFEVQLIDSSERQMGPELTYELSYQLNCPGCENTISLEFGAYEYPAGVLHQVDERSSGATSGGEPKFADLPDIDPAE